MDAGPGGPAPLPADITQASILDARVCATPFVKFLISLLSCRPSIGLKTINPFLGPDKSVRRESKVVGSHQVSLLITYVILK